MIMVTVNSGFDRLTSASCYFLRAYILMYIIMFTFNR